MDLAQYSLFLPRVFSLKGRLLDRELLRRVAGTKILEDTVSSLKGTVYEPFLNRLSKPYAAIDCERMLRQCLVNAESELVGYAPKGCEGFLTVHFERHVWEDLKVVLAAKMSGSKGEQVLEHLDLSVEEILGCRDLIAGLAKADGPDGALKMLEKTKYEKGARESYSLFTETGEVYMIHAVMDRDRHEELWSALRKAPRSDREAAMELIGIEFDAYNLLTIVRSKMWGIRDEMIRKILLPRLYMLQMEDIENLVMADGIEKCLGIVRETDYGASMVDISQDATSRLEMEMRKLSRDRALTMFRGDIFNIGPLFGIIKLREIETRNLVAIFQGVQRGIPSSEILENVAI